MKTTKQENQKAIQEYFDSLDRSECQVSLSFLGSYRIEPSKLQKRICPQCGAEELVPFLCSASILSGAHTIFAHCNSCGKESSFKDSEYYHKIVSIALTQGVKIKNEVPIPHYEITKYEKIENPENNIDVCTIKIGKQSCNCENKNFPKLICPICGKEEVLPYSLDGQIISRNHKFLGFCTNCNEHFSFEQSEYFCMILNSNKDRLQKD
jgi:DNA-directed RNA polymerase subunit M/transcription elongation factor TFIIS